MNPQQPDFSAFTGYPGYGGMFAQPQATFGAYFPGIQMPTAAASDAVTGHVKKEIVASAFSTSSSSSSSGSDAENLNHSGTSSSFQSPFASGYGGQFGGGFMANSLAQLSPMAPQGLYGMPGMGQWPSAQTTLPSMPTGMPLSDVYSSQFGSDNSATPSSASAAATAPWHSTPIAAPQAPPSVAPSATTRDGEEEESDEEGGDESGSSEEAHDDSGIHEFKPKLRDTPKMPRYENGGPPYMVHGRLVLLNTASTMPYTVSVEELKRRTSAPEKLNVSIISAILRRAKKKSGNQQMINELKAVGVKMTCGARKNYPANSFTAFCEGEAWKLASDYDSLSKAHFPVEACARRLIADTPGTPEMKYQAFYTSMFMVEQAAKILDSDRSPGSANGLGNLPPILDPTTQSALNDFTLRTHGFGVAAHATGVNTLLCVLRYATCLLQYQQPKFMNATAFRRQTMP